MLLIIEADRSVSHSPTDVLITLRDFVMFTICYIIYMVYDTSLRVQFIGQDLILMFRRVKQQWKTLYYRPKLTAKNETNFEMDINIMFGTVYM